MAGKTNWRPIENAPKDGTVVDIWCDSSARPLVGQYGRRCNYKYLNKSWVAIDTGFVVDRIPEVVVTHYMPLPPRPRKLRI